MSSSTLKKNKLQLVNTSSRKVRSSGRYKSVRFRNREHSRIRYLIMDYLRIELIHELMANLLRLGQKKGEIKVEIYLPNANENHDSEKIDRLKVAVSNYFNSSNIKKDESKDSSEIWGSWKFVDWFKSILPALGSESKDVYKELKEAARRASIDKVGAENMLNRAKATKELLDSVKDFDEVILKLGDVVIAKAEVNGKSRTIVVTISPILARELDSNPKLLMDPVLFIEYNQSPALIPASETKKA